MTDNIIGTHTHVVRTNNSLHVGLVLVVFYTVAAVVSSIHVNTGLWMYRGVLEALNHEATPTCAHVWVLCKFGIDLCNRSVVSVRRIASSVRGEQTVDFKSAVIALNLCSLLEIVLADLGVRRGSVHFKVLAILRGNLAVGIKEPQARFTGCTDNAIGVNGYVLSSSELGLVVVGVEFLEGDLFFARKLCTNRAIRVNLNVLTSRQLFLHNSCIDADFIVSINVDTVASSIRRSASSADYPITVDSNVLPSR